MLPILNQLDEKILNCLINLDGSTKQDIEKKLKSLRGDKANLEGKMQENLRQNEELKKNYVKLWREVKAQKPVAEHPCNVSPDRTPNPDPNKWTDLEQRTNKQPQSTSHASRNTDNAYTEDHQHPCNVSPDRTQNPDPNKWTDLEQWTNKQPQSTSHASRNTDNAYTEDHQKIPRSKASSPRSAGLQQGLDNMEPQVQATQQKQNEFTDVYPCLSNEVKTLKTERDRLYKKNIELEQRLAMADTGTDVHRLHQQLLDMQERHDRERLQDRAATLEEYKKQIDLLKNQLQREQNLRTSAPEMIIPDQQFLGEQLQYPEQETGPVGEPVPRESRPVQETDAYGDFISLHQIQYTLEQGVFGNVHRWTDIN